MFTELNSILNAAPDSFARVRMLRFLCHLTRRWPRVSFSTQRVRGVFEACVSTASLNVVFMSQPTGGIYLSVWHAEWRFFPHSPLPVFLPARWGETPVAVLSRICVSLQQLMCFICSSGFWPSARCKVCFLGLVQSFSHYTAIGQRLVSGSFYFS